MNLTNEIIHIAGEAGFARAGVSPPSLSEKYVTAYQQRSEAGFFGTMNWMRRFYDYPTYLQNRLPWAKSVLVAIDNYFQAAEWPAGIPKIARYAWGADYHKVIARKLKKVCRRIKDLVPEVIYRAYVDNGPIMQKAFAAQAGLGWIGKNSLLIVPGIGSYCFIGIVFLSIELNFNVPITAQCGRCRRCLEACPNKALVNEYALDARRCTAYLTIEKTGDFTASEMEKLQGWLYGCDICQIACPYNRKWNRPGDAQYGAYFKEFGKPVDDWLKLTEDEFDQFFRNSPIRRRGFASWRRNLRALVNNDHF